MHPQPSPHVTTPHAPPASPASPPSIDASSAASPASASPASMAASGQSQTASHAPASSTERVVQAQPAAQAVRSQNPDGGIASASCPASRGSLKLPEPLDEPLLCEGGAPGKQQPPKKQPLRLDKCLSGSHPSSSHVPPAGVHSSASPNCSCPKSRSGPHECPEQAARTKQTRRKGTRERIAAALEQAARHAKSRANRARSSVPR